MTSKGSLRPTDGELEILRVLWKRGPSTVREVHERIRTRRRTAYTTTLKMMQLMAEKGLLSRDDSSRTHVYSPALGEKEAQQGLVSDLLERAFGGSAEKLVLRALSAKEVPPEELAHIRSLLDEMERRGKK